MNENGGCKKDSSRPTPGWLLGWQAAGGSNLVVTKSRFHLYRNGLVMIFLGSQKSEVSGMPLVYAEFYCLISQI